MNPEKEIVQSQDEDELTEDEKLDQALTQMEMLCRSRCVQSPLQSNVTIREINKEN